MLEDGTSAGTSGKKGEKNKWKSKISTVAERSFCLPSFARTWLFGSNYGEKQNKKKKKNENKILLNMLIRYESMCVCTRKHNNTHWLILPHVIFFSGEKRLRLWPNWVYFRYSQRAFSPRIRTATTAATTVTNDVTEEWKKSRGNVSNIAHKLIFKMKKFHRCTDDDAKANEDFTSWKFMRLLIYFFSTRVSVSHTTWTGLKGRIGCSIAKVAGGRRRVLISSQLIILFFIEETSHFSDRISILAKWPR